MVERFRVGQPAPNVVRVVLDARTKVNYRVERDGDSRAAEPVRPPPGGRDQSVVAAVDAVEVAERDHRTHPARRARILGKVDDVH